MDICPAVSVIIPTYNRMESLAKAINSVLAQTFTDFELLICDDGSTDNTAGLVAGIHDPRIRWLAGPHSGKPAIPRNRGMQRSRGTWIALLDSDDEWHPDKLEKQLNMLAASGKYAISSNGWAYNAPNTNTTPVLMSGWANKSFSFKDMMRINLAVTSAVVFHRSLLEKTGGFPEGNELKTGEDYALWLRIATFTDFSYIAEPQVNYLDMPSQSVRGLSPQQTFTALQNVVLRNYLKWCRTSGYAGPLRGIARRRIVFNHCYGAARKLKHLALGGLNRVKGGECRK